MSALIDMDLLLSAKNVSTPSDVSSTIATQAATSRSSGGPPPQCKEYPTQNAIDHEHTGTHARALLRARARASVCVSALRNTHHDSSKIRKSNHLKRKTQYCQHDDSVMYPVPRVSFPQAS